MPRLFGLLFALASLSSASASQTQQVLFPGETGETLQASLRAAYKPTSGQLPSSSAGKDLMMYPIWTVDEGGGIGVQDVYTGWFVAFQNDPPGNANQEVFNNGAGNGLNQEHVWPRSRLNGSSSATSERDLHHLFPSRVDVNSDRGSLPFADIDDALTTRWYADGVETGTAPTSDRDAYSELRTGVAFEPRESVKGDVARAMFYVATMYPSEADLSWFASQERPLYEWHNADRVDAAEFDRTVAIASSQGGTNRENPFVLDSTLVRRAFFPGTIIDAEAGAPNELAIQQHGPNPFRAATRLVLDVSAPTPVHADLLDARGRTVSVLYNGLAPAGPLELALEGHFLAPGVYSVRVVAGEAVLTRRLVRAR
ncbi:MAG: endonuclease [Bacteroidota bacterium]